MGQENVVTERYTPFFIQNSFVINDTVKNESKEYSELSEVSLWH